MQYPFPVLACLLVSTAAFGHDKAEVPADADSDRRIEFPDTARHLTLVVDLHTHSVFSDGHVWPRTRVEEALRDGLDGLAITEHLEWQPHRVDLPNPDRNRAFAIARDAAADSDLLVIAGSEITREMPVGHINAVFLDDANALFSETAAARSMLDADDYYEETGLWPAGNALEAANQQNAFVIWNHPDYVDQAPDGIARPTPFHLAAFEKEQIHGIEIANGDGYSEEAFQVALDHDLTLIGVSDIHELIDWDYEPHEGGHRPVTLVLAEARSETSLKEALFAGRTVVWYKNLLLGREQHLRPLLEASLVAGEARYATDTLTAEFTLVNRSDARLILENTSDYSFTNEGDLFEIAPHSSVDLTVRTKQPLDEVELGFVVRNALVAPRQPARLRLSVPIAAEPAVPSGTAGSALQPSSRQTVR